MDDVAPNCKTERGCLIPRVDEEGRRILEVRRLLLSLGDLIDPGTVCRICNVDRDDLELLARIQETVRAARNEEPKG